MRFAIYARKSIYSDTSDSVGNQERMCREYVDLKFAEQMDACEIYQDEGFTGANTNRPGLTRLMSDVRDGMIDALIVYQLDRISRDVRDFSNIYAVLEEKSVMFISIKENIDTATPIGRAMMYVTMVFAQMERETIAARVTDNMVGLARQGWWAGGNPPLGYVRERVVVDGKKHVTIVPDPEGSKYIRWLFDTFLQRGTSLQGLETAFKREGIKAPGGGFFSTTQLHQLLTSPFCAPASPRLRDYWISQGCKVIGEESEWDGSHGVMIYGRTTQKAKTHQKAPRSEWTVCVGRHVPFIDEDTWLAAQMQFKRNTFEKAQKYDIPLLKGVLRCAKCGGLMQVARKKLAHSVSSHYYCLKRMRQGIEACDTRMLKCEVLDSQALQIFRRIEADPDVIRQYTKEETPAALPDLSALQKKIKAQEAKISRLTESLAISENSGATKYIIAEIERQDLELQAMHREIELAKTERRKAELMERTLEDRIREISDLARQMDQLTAAERNAIVKDVVQECTWDGATLRIRL